MENTKDKYLLSSYPTNVVRMGFSFTSGFSVSDGCKNTVIISGYTNIPLQNGKIRSEQLAGAVVFVNPPGKGKIDSFKKDFDKWLDQILAAGKCELKIDLTLEPGAGKHPSFRWEWYGDYEKKFRGIADAEEFKDAVLEFIKNDIIPKIKHNHYKS